MYKHYGRGAAILRHTESTDSLNTNSECCVCYVISFSWSAACAIYRYDFIFLEAMNPEIDLVRVTHYINCAF